jgi:DegV family protein with EDD domain
MTGGQGVAVVTESVASLSPEKVEAGEITVIPIPFSYAGSAYLDGVDITADEFYGMMSPDLPPAETSAPSPGAYMETFSELRRAGYEVLCITATAKLARMHDAAMMGERMAREEGVGGRIEIFDSGTAAMAQGFLVVEAARMAREGAGMDDILGRVRRLSGSVYLLAALDTLDYLAKTARIPSIGAVFGKVLQIKPIILFAQGTAKSLEHPRSRRRAKSRLLALMDDRLQGGLPLHVAVQHAAALEEAEALMKEVEERFCPNELSIHEFSPVMASYTGPGFLGLAFYEDLEAPQAHPW